MTDIQLLLFGVVIFSIFLSGVFLYYRGQFVPSSRKAVVSENGLQEEETTVLAS